MLFNKVYIEMTKRLKDSPELNPDTKGRGANTSVMLFVDFTRYFAYVVERKINFYFQTIMERSVERSFN